MPFGVSLQNLTLPLIFLCSGVLLAFFTKHTKDLNSGCSLLPHKHFWLYSNHVVTPGGVIAAAVEINAERIVSVVNREKAPKQTKGVHVIDYGNAVIMPGLVDVHVHLNEPGRVEWEGFETGTKAAAAGGVTTLIDMPLNSVPTTTSKEAFEMKVDAAKGKLFVDVGFWGGLVPENAFNITALNQLLGAGVLGLKSFMCPSGINDFPMTNASHIKAALEILANYRRPLLVHAEIPQSSQDERLEADVDGIKRRMYSTYLETRPPSWEEAAVKELVTVAKDTIPNGPADGAHIHIVHLSDASASLDLIKEAKESGARITVETCPHYLAFAAEEISDGDTRFKCAPPIRDAVNRDHLWKALKEGHIDMLSSDHSPSSPELKNLETGDFLSAWGGISSLQFGLPVTWSYGQHYGLELRELSEWWSSRPAKLSGLQKKGAVLTCEPALKGLLLDGKTIWKNPTGYLPGRMAPLMTFYGFMSLAYLLLGVIWFSQYIRFWKDVLQLQNCITLVIALGMFEMTLWYFEYANFNATGVRPMGITFWAVTFGAVKKTVARLLLLVVSMGYGVVRPTLGGLTSKVLLLGATYFLASELLDVVENVGTIDDLSGKTRMFLVLPVAILDAFLILWIFTSLSKTLEKLQARRRLAKLEIYRKFTNALAVAVIVSVAWIGYELYFKATDPFSERWQSAWIITGFWHMLSFALLCVLCVLWAPSQSSTRYAYSEEVGEDFDEEEALALTTSTSVVDTDVKQEMKERKAVNTDVFSLDDDTEEDKRE